MISTEISPDIAALVERLIDSKPGAAISYAELDKVIGRRVQSHYWMVLRAKDIAARDHGAIFGTIRGEGLTRLAPDEAHQIGHTARSRVKRMARKAAKTIRYAVSRQNELAEDATRKINAELSVLGLLEHLSRDGMASPQDVHNRRAEPVAVVGRRLIEAIQ